MPILLQKLNLIQYMNSQLWFSGPGRNWMDIVGRQYHRYLNNGVIRMP